MKDLISDKAGREDLRYIRILINGLAPYEETPELDGCSGDIKITALEPDITRSAQMST